MGLIYIATNQINNKSYIGQTTETLERRWYRHITTHINYPDAFHSALKEYGCDNFVVRVLEDNIPDDKLNERESYYIKKYNTFIKDNGNGYNSTRGGLYDMQDINSILTPSKVSEIINFVIIDIFDRARNSKEIRCNIICNFRYKQR